MKCPHCQVAIHEAYAGAQIADAPLLKKADGSMLAPHEIWQTGYQRCPECHNSIIILKLYVQTESTPQQFTKFLVYPRATSRPTPPPEVIDPYRQDFTEACAVLPDSEKASAALSRRCLQMLLRDKGGIKHGNLYNEIEEFIATGKVPSDIEDSLHAVRQIGNFAAHPIKSQSTGSIVDVEVGEAEWNLDVLERLFDYFFVGPAITAKRKAELNKKLVDAGKPPL